jgi:pimeloyl-ACP methyl ester carboxylesterase
MTTIKTKSGAELYIKDWGTGPTVLLCHGWPLSSDMWEYQMMHLASHGCRVVAHDRRGFGRSSQPWNGYDYDTFADDLADLIGQLDLSDITLVGFSMGGGEVARYLARHGSSRVAKAVLVSAVTPLFIKTPDHVNGVEPGIFDQIRAGILSDRAGFFDSFGRVFYSANREGVKLSEGILSQTFGIAMQASLKGAHDCVTAFAETDFRPDMKAFNIPTLIIHGSDDQVVPYEPTGKLAAQMIPGSRLVVYEDAPHGLCFTHKDRLNKDLLEFVTT